MAIYESYFQLPLVDAKASIIRREKAELHQMLSLTDWLIIRREDTGDNIPESVTAYRTALRQQQSINEALINSASTMQSLQDICSSLTRIYQTSITEDVIEYLTLASSVLERIIQEV